MGKPATRQGDISTGHGAWAPRPANVASPDVFVEGKPLVRQGDPWTIHCVGLACHAEGVVMGSQTVFCNTLGSARMGDQIACGGFSMQGASTVFIAD